MEKKTLTDEKLEKDYQEIYNKIVEARKKNYDTRFVELKLLSLKPKMKYAGVTEDEKDIKIVRELINEITQELSLCKIKTSIRAEIEKEFADERKKEIKKE